MVRRQILSSILQEDLHFEASALQALEVLSPLQALKVLDALLEASQPTLEGRFKRLKSSLEERYKTKEKKKGVLEGRPGTYRLLWPFAGIGQPRESTIWINVLL